MKRLEDLVQRAKKLKERGLTTGEIADELNVSRETALWLLTQSEIVPEDIYIEWGALANAFRLRSIAAIMADMIQKVAQPEVVVGVATSGLPIATMVAEELGCEFGMYYPRKLKWEENKPVSGGILSENFARIEGRECVVVDDIITTGSTIKEVAEYAARKDAELQCACVIIDKKGFDKIAGFPVLSIFRILRL